MQAKDLLMALAKDRIEVCYAKLAACRADDAHGQREWKHEAELAREAFALANQIPEALELQAKERWNG